MPNQDAPDVANPEQKTMAKKVHDFLNTFKLKEASNKLHMTLMTMNTASFDKWKRDHMIHVSFLKQDNR